MNNNANPANSSTLVNGNNVANIKLPLIQTKMLSSIITKNGWIGVLETLKKMAIKGDLIIYSGPALITYPH